MDLVCINGEAHTVWSQVCCWRCQGWVLLKAFFFLYPSQNMAQLSPKETEDPHLNLVKNTARHTANSGKLARLLLNKLSVSKPPVQPKHNRPFSQMFLINIKRPSQRSRETHIVGMSQVTAESELASDNQPAPLGPVPLPPSTRQVFLSCPNQPAWTHSQGL